MTDQEKLADCIKRLAEEKAANFALKLELMTARKYLRAVRDGECWRCVIGLSHEQIKSIYGKILDPCDSAPEKLAEEYIFRFPREP
jgi:hypothetical protein